MANTERSEPTQAWLEQINAKLSKKDVPHRQRAGQAWMEWSKYVGISTSFGDEAVKKIFAWFEKNTREGSQHMGLMYIGSFYYDSCFWPISIPVEIGTRKLHASNALSSMPEVIKARLMNDNEKSIEFVAVWADCIDYAFGIEGSCKDKNTSIFGQELLRSADQQLSATVSLLHEANPSPRAIESSRMATEMFLKAFLARKPGLTETEKKGIEAIKHKLGTALQRCLEIDNTSELKFIQSDLSFFPLITDRYTGTDKTPKELWNTYRVAQFTGATLVRSLTGHDVRGQLALRR